MAKSNTQRTAKRRQHSEDRRLEVGVTPEAIERLDQLLKRHGATKRAMVERLILQGVVEKFSGADTARRLLAEYGNRRAAMTAFTKELRQEFPGFDQRKKLEYPDAYRRYNAVNKALGDLVKKPKD